MISYDRVVRNEHRLGWTDFSFHADTQTFTAEASTLQWQGHNIHLVDDMGEERTFVLMGATRDREHEITHWTLRNGNVRIKIWND